MNVQRVYVRTDDFQLAHRLLTILETYQHPVSMLTPAEPLPEPNAWWFGTPDEVEQLGGRGVGVKPDEVDRLFVEWAASRFQGSAPGQLVFGLDPGPRPGCAYLADGSFLGKQEMESIDDVLVFMENLIHRMKPGSVLVRVGHGSPNHRDRLINDVLGRGYHVEEVNEYRTSSGASRHAHGAAALKIAMLSGRQVHEQRNVEPALGELRNLQRISRQRSKGQLTISLELAKQVSQGLLSLDEALRRAGYDAS